MGVFYGVENTYDCSFTLLVICTVITIIYGFFMPYREKHINFLNLIVLIIATFAAGFNASISFTSFNSVNNGMLIGIITAPLVIICVLIFIRIIHKCVEGQRLCVESRHESLA